MDFNNSRNISPQVSPQVSHLENLLQPKGGKKSFNLPLNAPMINRIHKATPGCGSCGKKVA